MSNRRDDGEFVDAPAKGEQPTHAQKAADTAASTDKPSVGSTISRIIDGFERNSRKAFGSGHDAAGRAYALRAMEEADKHAAGQPSSSFVEQEDMRRAAKAERANSKDGGHEV